MKGHAVRKYLFLAIGLSVLGSLAAQDKAPEKAPAKAPAPRTLKVKLNYTGAGTVDDKHKIIVFVFDSPDFMQGNAMPVGAQSAATKNGTVTFPDLASSPVYLTAVFDPTGQYDGMSAPPSGSSVTLYGKTPGTPDPIKIEPGETVEVDLAFDDSAKMP
jgi:hypothetical protein